MNRQKRHAPYKHLKLALAGKGVNYRQLASLLNVSEPTINSKINGRSDFYVSEQRAICETYGLDESIFFLE